MSTTAPLIVIDGGDNVGKATQADLLARRLEEANHPVVTIDFPQYHQNAFGRLIDECLQGKHGDFLALDPRIAATLYAADRFESKGQLTAAQAEGKTLILDRYVTASMLHQGSKIEDPDQREQFLSWLEHVEYDIFGMPRPDLTIYLDVPPDESEKLLEYLVGSGAKIVDAAEKDRVHQAKVAACAQYLSNARDRWVTVSCMNDGVLRTRENIHDEIFTLVQEHFPDHFGASA